MMTLDYSALLPEVVLLATAVAALLAGSFLPRAKQVVVRWFVLGALIVSAVAAAAALHSPATSIFTGTYAIDVPTGIIRILAPVCAAVVILLGRAEFAGSARETETYSLVVLATLGTVIVAGATDLLVLMAGYLLASIPLYALIGVSRTASAAEATLKTYLMGALFGVLLLAGITVLAGLAATTTYQGLGTRLAHAPVIAVAGGIVAVLIGLLFKAGGVPGHFWVPDAAQAAGPGVAAFLTTVPKLGALVALARLVHVLPTTLDVPLLVAVLAALSMTIGNLAALAQRNVRRLLGWSTVSQVGYLLMPVAVIADAPGASTALLGYLVFYAISNLAVFAVAAVFRDREDLASWAGLGRAHPVVTGALIVGALSLLGTPPTTVFFGKLGVFTVAWDGGFAWLVVIAAANTVLSLGYYLRLLVAPLRAADHPARAARADRADHPARGGGASAGGDPRDCLARIRPGRSRPARLTRRERLSGRSSTPASTAHPMREDRVMTEPDTALLDLAHAHGVSTTFTDWRGEAVTLSTDSIGSVLAALDVDASDPAAALEAHRLAPWRRMLPPCVVTTGGQERWVAVHVPEGAPAAASVRLESDGERALEQVAHWVPPTEVDGRRVGEATFLVPADLPLGYHTIVATSGEETAETPLIVSPGWLGMPAHVGDARGWGFAAQLYSVRSGGSWGVGDLGDLTDLAVWSAFELGADYLLVNPLHAAEPVPPLEPSPYLPSSRRFFNPLYLRIEQIPEYASLVDADRHRVDQLGSEVRDRLNTADRIDRDAAWTAKLAALRILSAVSRSAGRELDFQAYRRREGDALTRFATWCVLAEEHGNDAREWPAELRDPDSPAVAAAARDRADERAFHQWLQWLVDEQLQHAQAKARGAGMALGTLHDLAVGVHPGGADVWRMPEMYATGIRVGAPPDPFNQLGQDWRQPPWRPDRLAEAGYAPFRDIIRAVLRHAGGVRVDHIIGLFRLWWIPAGAGAGAGAGAEHGAYVYYDHEAMIGVLALEAHRAGAVVVGEDLGVVDPTARTYLASRGILGTSILWFEKDGDAPLPAERWREWCLASVTTHDLPPTAGYLDGEHVRLQHRLGLLTGSLDDELAADAAERERWLEELRSRRLLAEDATIDEIVVALHRYLMLTPARLLNVALTDAVGDRRTQNQPGTLNEYPNWRVPLAGPDGRPILLDDLFATSSARLRTLTPRV